METKNKIILAVASVLLVVVVIAGAAMMFGKGGTANDAKEAKTTDTAKTKDSENDQEKEEEKEADPTKDFKDTVYGAEINPESESFAKGHTFEETDETVTLPEIVMNTNESGYAVKEDPETGILSSNVVLVDLDEGTIVAQRHPDEVMVPASMTKVLTLLVATRNLKNLDVKYTLTREDADYCYGNQCSVVGFEVDQQIPIKDCIYGSMIVSGADAVLGLTNSVSGTQDEFVKLMNAELENLGLSDTAHFTNAVGLYSDEHRCTCLDLAVITKEALYSQICRDAMGARTYITEPDATHPDGMVMSSPFNNRIDNIELPGVIGGSKTGFVDESGNCAISYFISNSGKHYVCVTANAPGKWQCTYDHAAIYNAYTK